MICKKILLFSFALLISLSCEKNSRDLTLDILVQSLDQELNPLSENPMIWSDNNLQFLDQIADKSIIGLGEASHGTSEFFKAKHRIFKYLVENHNYKIFAIEADFGESILINDAVQRGASNEIENLMKTKMHFWTWKTEEVKDLLVWMCTYNLNKSEEEKVQYMGIDCQYNTYNPDMVKAYLSTTDAHFYSFAESILDEAKSSSLIGFTSYSQAEFNNYLKHVDALQDTLTAHKNELIQASSEKQYLLYERILKIVRQVYVDSYYYEKNDYSINYRDQYMAENAAWLLDYFEGNKVVIWAHNTHVSNNLSYASLGYHLTNSFAADYAVVGFLFSRGSFTARGQEGTDYTDPIEQVIDTDPKKNSLNFVMSHCKESVFSVKIADLQKYSEWNDTFTGGIQFFDIGSTFNNRPEDYYTEFSPTLFDYIIYFDKSTASVKL